MGKIAVDVVLLPSQEMAQVAIKANRRLLLDHRGGIVLDSESCLPHVSLAMGCIEQRDVDDVGGILHSLAHRHRIESLKVAGIHIETNSIGRQVSSVRIERDDAIQALHEDVMERLAEYVSYDVAAEMLVSPSEVETSTLLWIENYRDKSSFANFFPHITLGYGVLEDFPLPASFTPSKLALCHLGNHCTCRKRITAAKMI